MSTEHEYHPQHQPVSQDLPQLSREEIIKRLREHTDKSEIGGFMDSVYDFFIVELKGGITKQHMEDFYYRGVLDEMHHRVPEFEKNYKELISKVHPKLQERLDTQK